MGFIIHYRPYGDRYQQKDEEANEYVILFSLYFMMVFSTDYITET